MPMVYDDNSGNYVWVDEEEYQAAQNPPPPPEVIYKPPSGAPDWYEEEQDRLPESGPGGISPPDIYPVPDGGAPTPDPYVYPGGGGGYGGYYGAPPPLRPFTGQLNYPQFVAPQFQAPAPFKYDPFSYESFSAPTLEQAQKEPGFEYAMQQGLKAMENSRAYLGTYRSGATIKGLNDYARNMANQNYDRVYERSADMYDRNRANAFGTYTTNRNNAAEDYSRNYGISRDVFDRNYQGAKDEYAGRARESELNFASEWDRYVYENDDAFRRWQAMLNANSQF